LAQRDYILRMIEQIGAAMIRLRQVILGGSESAQTIRLEFQSIARSAGVDLEMARLATPDTLIALLSVGGEVNPSRAWFTAELLYLDALDAETSGDTDRARLSYQKAVRLFSLLEPGGGFLVGWPEAGQRVQEVRDKLEALGR
jgi:hypothetical protein